MQDNPDKETSTDKVQRESKRIKNSPTGTRDFSVLQNFQPYSGTHLPSPSVITGAVCCWVGVGGGRAVDHSPASSSEVKNEWICTSAPPIRLRDVA
jgi:hypothetical protein